MLNNWLASSTVSPTNLPSYSWGTHLATTPEAMHQLPVKSCVLIGIDAAAADAVRTQLYPLSWPFDGLQLTDLGNVRKASVDFLIPLFRELLESQLFPILIGGKPEVVYAQFQAFLNLRDLVSLSVIDERVPFQLSKKAKTGGANYLQKIIHQRGESLFHLGLLAAQGHFIDPALLDWLETKQYEYMRLGELRQQLTQAEPILRNADLATFHIDALKQCEAPAQLNPSPSGLFLEEACQLMKYAGNSDKLRSFSIVGIDAKAKRKLPATAQAVAQLIWYLVEGYYSRHGDFPVSNKGLTEYIVDWKGNGNQKLTFWKSNKSERWWLQVPAKTGHKHKRHRLIPCSYEDYKTTTQDDLPDRLWRAIRRFG